MTVEPRVVSRVFNQLVVRALLDHTSAFDDIDHVGVTYRRQAVGDDHHRDQGDLRGQSS